MPHTTQSFSPAPPSSAEALLPQRAFRWIAALLGLWLAVGACYLYRQELAMKLGLWDAFAINAVNYSRFSDARDSEPVFQDQLLLVRQGYRSGALFVGPITIYSRQLLPIDSQMSYQMSFDLMTVTDGTNDQGSETYAGVVFYDEDQSIIVQPESHMYGVAWKDRVLRATGRLTLRGVFSPTGLALNRIPANARYIKIAIDLNYADPRAAAILSNITFVPLPSVVPGENK